MSKNYMKAQWRELFGTSLLSVCTVSFALISFPRSLNALTGKSAIISPGFRFEAITSVSNSFVECVIRGEDGIQILIESSANSTDWASVGLTSCSNGIARFTDSAPFEAPVRLYRLRVFSEGIAPEASPSSISKLRRRVAQSADETVTVKGYYKPGDEGGGLFYWDPTSVAPDNGGTIIKPDDGQTEGRWKRLYSGEIWVKWFGAVGDGATDDTLTIRAAAETAGPGGKVMFNPDSTYLVSSFLSPLSGQTWSGYGATIKRKGQVIAQTDSSIPADLPEVQITVSDPSQFYVGMHVTVFNGNDFDPGNHFVRTIEGDVLTLGTAFSVVFPSGGTVISSHKIIEPAITATKVTILGFEIDGNAQENDALQKWQNHSDICVFSDFAVVRDCFVHDSQSEGVIIGGVGGVVEQNRILNCQGNGIHLSANSQVKLIGNFIQNCNLAGRDTGHADGCIAFSVAARGDTVISGNYLENGLSGISGMTVEADSSVIITGNTIRNGRESAFKVVNPDTPIGKIIFSDNLVYDRSRDGKNDHKD